jgi:hypothetical protein
VLRAGLRGGERPHVTLPLSTFTLSLSAFNGSRLQSTSGLSEALGGPDASQWSPPRGASPRPELAHV